MFLLASPFIFCTSMFLYSGILYLCRNFRIFIFLRFSFSRNNFPVWNENIRKSSKFSFFEYF